MIGESVDTCTNWLKTELTGAEMSERNFAAGLADDARMIDRPYQWRKQWLTTWESDARRKGRDAGRIYALPSMKAGLATTENCMSAPQMFQSGRIVPARAAENRTGWGLQVRCGASGVGCRVAKDARRETYYREQVEGSDNSEVVRRRSGDDR